MADCELMSDRTPLLEKKDNTPKIESSQTFGFHTFEEDASNKEMQVINYKYGAYNEVDVADEEDECLTHGTQNEYLTDGKSSNIICIFAVAFDTRAGNIIEWCLPDDCDLDGIEFKAMASGSHRVQTDFIYFRRGRLYGLACFENMPVDNMEERGARMKSIGILGMNYTSLHQHMVFLQEQVRFLLEHPGSYSGLETYYGINKGVLPVLNTICEPNVCNSNPAVQDVFPLPLMKITHPAGCFSQYLNFFGDRIFLLWKLALLRKRIIFFSPPPIGVVCYRVYCTACLTAHRISELGEWLTQPLFYVNIADMDSLEVEKTYIACTTEKIFESKSILYDLYVDNQILNAATPMLQKMLTVGSADKVKYSQLCQVKSQVAESESEENSDEIWFIRFFMSLNEHLFSTLLSVSRTQEKQWTEEHMRSVGLDPVNDRLFIMELSEIYGIDIIMMVDNPCCPR